MFALMLALHLLAAIIWVGGMFFVLHVLRPSLGVLEPPPQRLKLMRQVTGRFFPIAAICAVVLLATGHIMASAHFGGFAKLPLYVHIMVGLGWIMVLLFAWMFRWPNGAFRRAVDTEAFPEAAIQLQRIRIVVAINMVLGIVTSLVAVTGPHWGV
jgi:uncharacterized membrane protein